MTDRLFSSGQRTIQLIIWVLAGTSVVNTLTIFYFTIQKCMSCKRNSDEDEHEYVENVIEFRPPTTPAANFNSPNTVNMTDEDKYADDDEDGIYADAEELEVIIYDDIKLGKF